MRATFIATALAAAAGASAQLTLPSSIFGLPFSSQCQQAVLGVLTNGNFSTCFHTTDLAPLLTSNGSIIPVLDQFMSDLCYDGANVCTNATLNAAAAQVVSGCAADLQQGGVSNATIQFIFNQYPLVREVLCLKTQSPYTSASYGGALGQPPIPIPNAAYNSTNGTFCVTSVLTQLSAYFGTNLTVPAIAGALSGQNSTAAQLATSINPNVICNECIFGAFDLVSTAYPTLGNTSVSSIYRLLNMTSPVPANVTLASAANGECAYKPLAINSQGQLPAGISVSIVNSTFPYNVTAGASA